MHEIAYQSGQFGCRCSLGLIRTHGLWRLKLRGHDHLAESQLQLNECPFHLTFVLHE
jgi:hypothetical protein